MVDRASPRVARVWLVTYNDAEKGRRELLATVYLQHNMLTGDLALDVRAESEVVVDGGAARVLLSKSHTVPFSIAASVGRASVSPKATGFDYTLTFGGKDVPEVQQRPVEWLAAVEPRGVTVAVGDDVEHRAGKSYYALVVASDGGEPRTTRKRYSEFADLYAAVLAAYHGSHLRTSVPAPPAKVLNPFVNQLDPRFVDNRRVELNDFVKKLVQLPRALSNPAVLDFFDLQLQTHVAPA